MPDRHHILDAIGNTPLVELRHIVPKGSARIVAKLESANPTGSMKDRLARTLIERAAEKGLLSTGGTVVETRRNGISGVLPIRSITLVCMVGSPPDQCTCGFKTCSDT